MTPFSGEKPQRGVRLTFSALVDPFITWFLGTFWDELQAVIAAFNFNATNATSVTSLTVGSGANKSLTTQTGKSYNEAMTIKVAYKLDPTIWMLGDLISYDSGTGALVFYPRTKNGSGTYADWVIAQSPTADEVGNHCVWVHTGNGFGSTNTKHRRYTTAKTNVGTAIIYADSATNGATFTINESGDYQMIMCDRNATASRDVYFGIAVNSSAGTTNIQGDAALLIYSYQLSNNITPLTITHRLSVGDVVTVKGGTGATYMPDATGENDSFFIIRKINNG
ncbi:MAG: hypothetical protein KBC53_04075 [Nitrosomonas sp.]|nr:hypothetical protein [Nitrosomonas sp.]